MPTLQEQLHTLDKAKCFSRVDVQEGYHHIPLDEESSIMTTRTRLMTALEGLEGIILVADDILTFGVGDTYEKAEANHDTNKFLWWKGLKKKI